MTKAEESLVDARQLTNLDEAFRWAMKQSPRIEPHDVVIQDEYTHDVIFRTVDGSCVVFDAT